MASLPFGKHKDEPLEQVPTDYLAWVVRTCKLSSGLYAAVADELKRRGQEAPPAPLARVPKCSDHPAADFRCRWREDSLGRKHIKAECVECGRSLGFVSIVPQYAAMADREEGKSP